jgi:hypothetical protein
MNAIQEPEVRDTRGQTRFFFRFPIEGTFNAYVVRLCNISSSGAQIEHADPLKLQSNAKLVITLPRSVDTITVRGQIVWSKLLRTPSEDGRYLYRSGVRLEGQGLALAATVDRIITVYSGEEDRESLERKRELLKEKMVKDLLRQQSASLDSTWRRLPSSQRRVDPDKVLLIEQTLMRLKREPQEIARLAVRARKALEGKPEGAGVGEQTLAVWEYLDHLIPLTMVDQVIGKK